MRSHRRFRRHQECARIPTTMTRVIWPVGAPTSGNVDRHRCVKQRVGHRRHPPVSRSVHLWFLTVRSGSEPYNLLLMDVPQPDSTAPFGGTWPLPYPTSKLWYVTVTAGTPRARTLAGALRKAREATGMSVRSLATALGVSHATVSKWENARMVPDAESVVAFLQAVGVIGDARERILSLVRGNQDPSWLAAGMAGASQGLAGVLECERAAVEIIEWAPLLVPGICQTRDTAHAIFRHDESLSPRELDALADIRVNRREILTNARSDDESLGPADYTALISANALREQIGGKEVAADQLRYLLSMAELPTVTIQVVPAGDDWHPGLSGPFILYNFADTDPIVHLEHHSSSSFLYDAADIRKYKVASTVIRRKAMSSEESAQLIADVINELEIE